MQSAKTLIRLGGCPAGQSLPWAHGSFCCFCRAVAQFEQRSLEASARFLFTFQKMRTYWAGIKEHVSSFDELDMATTRLRVRLPDEPKPDTPQMNILEPSEVDSSFKTTNITNVLMENNQFSLDMTKPTK